MNKSTAPNDDPVRRRRKLIATWTQRANRTGYLFYLIAIFLFVVAFTTDFSDTFAALITVSLVVGYILLAPAIVLGYAVKAAEKEDAGPDQSHR